MTLLLRLLGLEGGTSVESIVDAAWKITKPPSDGLLALVVGVALLLAAINFLPQIKMRASVRLWAFLLRLAMAALLLVVITQVELHLNLKLEEPQHWVVVVDDSGSMATADAADGKTRFAAALNDLNAIRSAAGNGVELDIRTLSGEPLGTEAGKGPTLIEKGIARAALSAADVDRVIFLTDGRDTESRDLTDLGSDLKARGIELDVKLYGSQMPPRDTAIFAEPERAVIRLGEELVIRGSITGTAGDQTHIVALKEDGRKVKDVEIPPDRRSRFIVNYKPKRSGRHTYTLALAGTDTLQMNNSYSFKAQVVEERIKVLMIEGFPGYEFKLMKYAVETDPMVELVTVCHIPGGGVYVQGNPLHRNPNEGIITSQADLFKYDVVILMDVSRQYFRAGGDISESRLRNIVEFVTKRGGGLIVCGGQDVFRAGGYQDSALMEVLPFDLSTRYSTEDQFPGKFFASVPKPAYSHPVLRMFADPIKNRERLNSLRQLNGSNNVGGFKPLATPLLTRFVKLPDARGEKQDVEVPLLAYQAVGEGKVVAAATDTFWRWQLQPDFDDPPLQALMANIIRYVAPPPYKQPGLPNVSLADASPQVGQEVVLATTLKDKNYDPIQKADLKVTVTRPDGSTQHLYPRDLPEQPGYYEYRVPLTMPGTYDVTAAYNKQTFETSFVVEASGSEYAELSADADAMAALTKAAGGRIIESVDAAALAAGTQPSAVDGVRDLQVWNSPLVLILFVGLVCIDCFIRKRQGLA